MTEEQTAVLEEQDQDQELNQAENSVRKREEEHYSEIKELNKSFVAAHQRWEILKDQTSGAKKYCDELGKRLSNLIASGPDYQLKLDLDGKQSAPADQVAESNQVEAESNAWREVKVVDALGLTATQLDKLEGEGILTMGQLEDFRAEKGLQSIKGFGEKAVTKIEDQILDWLQNNRDKFGEVVDETNGESDETEESDDEALGVVSEDEDEEEEDQDEDEADELLDDM